MKSKASLVLMEQLVMVLVFSLAAVLCLQVFVKTQKMSEEITHRDEAVVIAQNAAQALKTCGDPKQAKDMVDCSVYSLQIREIPTEIPGLRTAEITVFYENMELFSLKTGWQEVDG